MNGMQKKKALTIGGILVILGLLLGMYSGLEWVLAAPPPKINLEAAYLTMPVKETSPGVRQWQDCFAFRREGIAACFLQGQPEVQGVARAFFYPEEFRAVDELLFSICAHPKTVPLGSWVRARYQTLCQLETSEYLPEALQKEIFAFSRFSENPFPHYGSFYQRLIQNQTLFDHAHSFSERQAMGSSAFGVAALNKQQHSPMMAYNLDFVSGEVLDQNKMVVCVHPENGHAFLAVTWPGQFGIAAGVNAFGIGIALQPVPTSSLQKQGMPVPVLARKVLTDASNLQQAIAILQAAPIRVSAAFLVGSGKENRFVVVEKAATLTAVRDMENGEIVATNHFLSPLLAGENTPDKRSGPSQVRLQRIRELLYLHREPMTIASAVAILRDQRGKYGERMGTGNAEAINSVRAVQSVVLDLKQRRLWIAQAPHQFGKYVPFALDDFILPPQESVIEADPFLTSGKYNEYLVFQNGLGEAERQFQAKKYQDSLAWLQEVQFLNPLDYHAFYLAGKALQALGRTDEAAYNFQQALKLHPAFLKEKAEIRKRLEALPKEMTETP